MLRLFLLAIMLSQTFSSPLKMINPESNTVEMYITNSEEEPETIKALEENCKHYSPEKYEKCKRQLMAFLASRFFVEPKSAHRSARSSVLGHREECNLSKDKLKQLRDIVKESLTQATQYDVQNSQVLCELNFSETRSCEKLIKMLQCGLNHMKTGLFKLFAEAGASSEETAALKRQLEKMSNDYQRVADDVERLVSQEYKKQIQAMRDELEKLRKNIANPHDTLCIVEDCTNFHHRGEDVQVCRPKYCFKL